MKYIIIAILAYFIGTIPFSIILGKAIKNMDIRNYGSGNAGATNVTRILGFKLGTVVFLLDFLKGAVAVFLGQAWGQQWGGAMAAIAAVLGHDFPFYLSFRGGKGISTTLGAYGIINFWGTLILGVSTFSIGFIKRTISIGSLLFLSMLPIMAMLVFKDLHNPYVIAAFVLAILGIYQHRSNITRLLRGDENKFGGNNT